MMLKLILLSLALITLTACNGLIKFDEPEPLPPETFQCTAEPAKPQWPYGEIRVRRFIDECMAAYWETCGRLESLDTSGYGHSVTSNGMMNEKTNLPANPR